MSTKTIPLLARPEYEDLELGTWTVESWFREWARALDSCEYKQMYGLLHWGLQAAGTPAEKVSMYSFYLDVADGHSDNGNYGRKGPQEYTIFGPMDRATALYKLAEKAWQELCNRFFVLGGENIPSDEPVHMDLLLLNTDLSRKVICFFDPRRYEYNSSRNLDHHPNNAYGQKAREFLRVFVYKIWDGEVVLRNRGRGGFYTESEADRQSAKETCQYYISARPDLVEIMYEYGWLDFLKTRSLDLPTRRKLRELALSTEFSTDEGKLQSLEDAYSMLDPEYGRRYVSRSRKSAEILLLYPLARLGRWKFLRAQRLKHEAEAQERAAREREALRKEQQRIEAQLSSLS